MRLGRGQDRLAWMLWLKVRIAVSLRLFEDAPGSGRLSSAATAQTWALAQTIVADHAGSHVGVPEIAVFARIPRCAARANARHETARRMNLELEQATTVRLDVWLWAARFFKTRSLAKNAVETGKVDVAGQRPKPSRTLRSGEQLRIDRGGEIFEITVAALSAVRGAAPVAQALYVESDSSREARAQWRLQRAAERTGYRAPEGKPDKRARRLITALGDIDAF